MLDTEIKVNQFLVGYCRMLVKDIADERLAEQPLPGVNHPAWILGHLAYSADGAISRLGGQKLLSAEWVSLFGPGSKVTSLRSDYPAMDELVRAVEQGFEKARQLAQTATPEQLAMPNPNAVMKAALPTVRDGVAFLLTGHLGVHLGQFSAWRRMIGLAPMF
jgi:hypothetical protein